MDWYMLLVCLTSIEQDHLMEEIHWKSPIHDISCLACQGYGHKKVGSTCTVYRTEVAWLDICFALWVSSKQLLADFQVVEIGKGSKVKYELDKKSGLIKVIKKSLLSVPWLSFLHTKDIIWYLIHSVGPCTVLICCVSSQLRFHPSDSLWG